MNPNPSPTLPDQLAGHADWLNQIKQDVAHARLIGQQAAAHLPWFNNVPLLSKRETQVAQDATRRNLPSIEAELAGDIGYLSKLGALV